MDGQVQPNRATTPRINRMGRVGSKRTKQGRLLDLSGTSNPVGAPVPVQDRPSRSPRGAENTTSLPGAPRQDIVRLLVEAVGWRKRYDDANPDVGWGPSLETLLTRTLEDAGVEVTTEEYTQALAQIRRDFNGR